MAGRRLIDAVKLLNASRTIVKQHLELRSQQLDAFNKTSTLAKAVKDQTDRVTLTAQAAIALARRLNEEDESQVESSSTTSSTARGNNWTSKDMTSHQRGSGIGSDIRLSERVATVTKERSEELQRGHDQDVHYRPQPNPRTKQSSSEPELEPKQKIPEHAESERELGHDVEKVGINSDVFPLPRTPASGRRTVEEAPPAGVDVHILETARRDPNLSQSSRERTSIAQEVGSTVEKKEAPGSINKPTFTPEISPRPDIQSDHVPFQMRQSRVPSSRLGRLWQYGGLATSMALGAVGESLRRATGGSDSSGGSLMLSPSNLERLVAKLSRMRGAALKLGQMISFQDLRMLPAPIHEVLQRVQDSADYMPPFQRDGVLASNLGSDWRDLFASFDEVPVAAASIGQVHRAVLKSSGKVVAVKVQYPGVATSIDSDLNNLSILLTASRLLPKGLFLDKTIANARTELAWECDYLREAECARRFRLLLADETDVFTVPDIIDEASGREVLTADFMRGTAVTKLPSLTQPERDWIGTQILRLCLREICEFKFMQTDPNWTNFLYNPQNQKLELLDFGASRDFPDEFIKPYIGVLSAASRNDRDAIKQLSVQLGYLTGHESTPMANAHVDSVLTLAEPFSAQAPELYDFRDQTITDRVRDHIPLMLRERLAPPPEETYSLHRKLSGAFLLCARLGSRIRCKEMFSKAIYGFE